MEAECVHDQSAPGPDGQSRQRGEENDGDDFGPPADGPMAVDTMVTSVSKNVARRGQLLRCPVENGYLGVPPMVMRGEPCVCIRPTVVSCDRTALAATKRHVDRHEWDLASSSTVAPRCKLSVSAAAERAPTKEGERLTYCLALRLNEGMVFLADTRTNAGVDNVGVYRKMHILHPAPDRVFVVESAGSLATTQEVLDRINSDLSASDGRVTLASVNHLFEAALYLGRLGREVATEHQEGLRDSGADGTATFILGGHVGSESPDIILVYPEGNYIRASDERPFLQIGETKYGKFMLELAVEARVDLETATKIALGSMMSTARANLSVGPPYDVGIYLNDSREMNEFRIQSDSPLLEELREVFERLLLNVISELPAIRGDDLEEALEDSG